jgi:hypothetical protein
MGGFMNSSSFLRDFFRSLLSQLGRMNTAEEAWQSLLLVALFGLLLFLRIKYPDPSKGAETAVLVGATILFFSICNVSLSPHRPAAETVQEVRQAHGSLLKH